MLGLLLIRSRIVYRRVLCAINPASGATTFGHHTETEVVLNWKPVGLLSLEGRVLEAGVDFTSFLFDEYAHELICLLFSWIK